MDYQVKQWRNQLFESEQHCSGKMQKPHFDPHLSHQSPSAALPLFIPEPNPKISNVSGFPDPSPASAIARFPRTDQSYFSWSQWQELELQALIYRYMLAGAPVPQELLLPIKKSLLHCSPYFLHHVLQQHSFSQPTLLTGGYWGRAGMDPEPGRCRRTDGKKWRCSRDVVTGQKYCERHVHRGRNRAKKPAEIPTPTASTAATSSITCDGNGGASPGVVRGGFNRTPFGTGGTRFSLSSCSDSMLDNENKGILVGQQEHMTKNRSDGRILRHFFDDWPRSVPKPPPRTNAATSLSNSPGKPTSDVSLKLSTGSGEEPVVGGNARENLQLNWGSGWNSNQAASMGGPLAEALRSSSTTNSSPTSILLQKFHRCSASESNILSA